MKREIYTGAAKALLLLLLSPCALAQDDVANEQPVQVVQISGTRDPALLPYADVVMLRSVFAEAPGAGAIRAGIKVSSKQDGGKVENLHVNFAANGKQTELPLKSGFVLLSELPTSEDPKAEFLTNKRKGSLRIEILLTVELKDSQHFTLGELARTMEQGNKIRSTVLPWYLRLVVPKFQRADVCFAAPGGSASIIRGELRQELSASSSDDCLPLQLDRAASETIVDLNQMPLYVRLL